MSWRLIAAVGALGLLGMAAPALADDMSDVKQELDSLKRKVRELEGTSLTQDEVDAAVNKYFAGAPANILVGGADEGKAGWPKGKKPFIKEGPNKLEFGLRYQVRYSMFDYSDSAVGTVGNGSPEVISLSGEPPRNRSGFELERMYLVFEGTVFCEDISFKLELNFDTDSGQGLEKNYAYLDWKYSGEHHIRAGSDKAAYCYEENNSSSALAFVDRDIVTKAFEIGFNTGVAAWGYFGELRVPEAVHVQGPGGQRRGPAEPGGQLLDERVGRVPYNRDARDTFSDQLLFSAALEYVITCDEFKWDEVDNRPCDKRGKFAAAVGVAGYYENDDDTQHAAWGGLALRSTGRADRTGADLWFRMHWNGWSLLAEGLYRDVDYTAGSTAPTQTDYGAQLLVHYRFAESNWGIGARYGVIWLDSDYQTITVNSVGTKIPDTISEVGMVVNYFFWDHSNKIQLDVNYVMDNSGVNSSSAGYMFGTARGVVIEDGLMVRIQWQINI